MSTDYRVLVVEDDASVRGLVIRSLTDIGIHCDAASDGQRGRDLIHEGAYDAVILDLLMPNINGHALAVEVLSLPKPPLTLIVTGVTAKKIVRDLVLRGVQEIAFKPVDYELVACKMLAWLDRRRHGSLGIAAAPSQEAQRPLVHGCEGVAEADASAARRAIEMSHPGSRLLHGDDAGEYRRITVVAKVNETELDSKLRRLSGIQPISAVALEVYYLTKSESAEIAELVELIEQDNALSVQLLRIANSAAYNRSRRRIMKLEEVVVQIGRRRVGEAALAVTSMRALSANRLPWLDQNLTWLRSLAAAFAIRLLMVDATEEEQEGLFLGALLHLSGRIVLGAIFPKQYQAIVAACNSSDLKLRDKEADFFPINHAEVMSRLLACWNVPAEIHLPLKYSLLNYASLGKLTPTLRHRVVALKMAAFIARLAVGRWEPWDTVEFPPADAVQSYARLNLGAAVEQLRSELHDLVLLQEAIEGETATALPVPRKIDATISYCDLANSQFDFFAALAPALGLQLNSRSVEDASPGENFLINSLGVAAAQTPNIDGLAASGGRHLFLVDERAAMVPLNFARVESFPVRFGRLEHACREIAST